MTCAAIDCHSRSTQPGPQTSSCDSSAFEGLANRHVVLTVRGSLPTLAVTSGGYGSRVLGGDTEQARARRLSTEPTSTHAPRPLFSPRLVDHLPALTLASALPPVGPCPQRAPWLDSHPHLSCRVLRSTCNHVVSGPPASEITAAMAAASPPTLHRLRLQADLKLRLRDAAALARARVRALTKDLQESGGDESGGDDSGGDESGGDELASDERASGNTTAEEKRDQEVEKKRDEEVRGEGGRPSDEKTKQEL
mmetsp:Transcript_11706/g.27269  ORF Transcript_11706/g.27269 Transcript_11706/m.27269 type:complete len:252 (-) Transcript_11706:791-1546(-)